MSKTDLQITRTKGAENLVLVTDSMRGAGMPEGESILGSLRHGQRVYIEQGVSGFCRSKIPEKQQQRKAGRSGFTSEAEKNFQNSRLFPGEIQDRGRDSLSF